MKRFLLFVFLLLLTAGLALPALSEDAPIAREYSAACVFEIEEFPRRIEIRGILDAELDRFERFRAGEPLAFSWRDAPEVRTLCVQWKSLPEGVAIRFFDADGAQVSETSAPLRHDSITPVPAGAVRAELVCASGEMTVGRIALFGEGALPAPFYDWLDTPDSLDYLVIATHPDDDVLYMGAVVPIYGAERGYTGTVAFATSPSRTRVSEALKGVWVSGCPYYPIFLGYPDLSYNQWQTRSDEFSPSAVTRSVVRMLRRYRPLVVFTQDVDGEYGHFQHLVLSSSVREAVRLAADPAYDPASAGELGVWQVQKCYVHLYPKNPLVLDIDAPLAAFGGRSAFEVAEEAFRMHVTQNGGRHAVHGTNGKYPISKFGMSFGTVEAGDDAFANIDPALLVSRTPPEEGQTPEEAKQP